MTDRGGKGTGDVSEGSARIFFRQYFTPETKKTVLERVSQILDSGQLMNGPYTERLERLAADYIGVESTASVNSCTTGLTICLKYFGVEGREVLVPAATFITSVSSIQFAGGVPVLVDVRPETLSFNLDELQRKVTPRTKGVVWPHLTGVVSRDHDEIVAFCRRRGLFLLEDCAQAIGATVGGRRAGSLGDAACFSFYATKILAAGNGGLVASDDGKLIEYAKRMRLFGKDAASGEIVDFGNDWFLDEFRAAVVLTQLEHIEENLGERRTRAAWYGDALRGRAGISFIDYGAGGEPAFYQYCALIDRDVDTASVLKNLRDGYGVDARIIYRPIHHEKIFQGLDTGDLGGAEETLRRAICLPLHHYLAEGDVQHVAGALAAVIERARR